jgi:hypothetical protein
MRVWRGRVSESHPPSSSKQPFWRNPSGAQIIVALIGAVGAIAAAVVAAVITSGDGDGGHRAPLTSSITTTPTKRPETGRGLTVLSPEEIKSRASSTLPSQSGNTYAAANTIDGDPRTAWSEGRQGPGIGATLTWTFRRRVDLRRVHLVNGYAKGDLFTKNLRIRGTRVTTAQGTTTATLRDSAAYQTLRIRPGPTDFVRIEILRVYGSRLYQDCLLSEAEFSIKDT